MLLNSADLPTDFPAVSGGIQNSGTLTQMTHSGLTPATGFTFILVDININLKWKAISSFNGQLLQNRFGNLTFWSLSEALVEKDLMRFYRSKSDNI